MILDKIRANAWKFAAIAVAVLAVAAVLAALYFRGNAAVSDASAGKAKQEAAQARAEVDALKAARQRDVAAYLEAAKARETVDTHTAQSNSRLTQIEVRYRDRIVEVPAACPAPDADLMRELAEQTARLSGAEDRLRRVRRAAEGDAGGRGGQ